MLTLLEYTVVIALIDAFTLTIAYKWGIIEYLQANVDAFLYKWLKWDTSLFNELFSCNFCMSWWMSWFFSLILLILSGDWLTLAVPFLATPISKKLL